MPRKIDDVHVIKCTRWSLQRLAAVVTVSVVTAVATAGAPPGGATVFFVDGDAARDGDGTAASPFNNLASLQTAILASSKIGLTIEFAGTFHGQQLRVEHGMTNSVLKQWPGKPQAVVRGDTIIRDGWTEEVPGMRYSVYVGLGIDVVGAVEDWDIRIDKLGRHYGHLTRVSGTAQVEASEGSWYYDGSRLHIHAIHDEDPNTNGRQYGWGIGGSGFYLLSDLNVTVQGLHFALWLDPDPGEGYGVFMGGAEHCLISDCLANDYGYHGFGFVGTWCRFNTFDRCVTRGGRANGSTAYIFYAFTPPFAVLDGCRAYDCVAHLYRHLNVYGDAPPYAPNSAADGFYIHTDGTMITDVEYHNCIAYGYENRSGYGFAVGMHSLVPTDLDDPETYPIRFYDCRLINGATNDINGGASAAYIRCSFDLLRMSELAPPSVTAVNTFATSNPTNLLFESCLFMVNTDGQPEASCFRLTSGVHLNLRGCVVYDNGRDTRNRRYILRYASPSAMVSASQTVFVHRTPQRLAIADGGLSIRTAAVDLHDCWYDNMLPDHGYGPAPEFDSLTEFHDVIDRTGVYDLDPQFVAAPLDLEGAPGGPLRTSQFIIPGVFRLGINLLPYDGHYGAYQYGVTCPADLDSSGRVDGLDLAMLLAAWGKAPENPAADLNGDGVVNGLDLALLLGGWGPCQ